MSNLLQPDDRFKKPDPRDEQGKNRFADPTDVSEAAAAETASDNLFATAAGERPYQPRFVATQKPRGILLLVLAILGLSGNAAATLALSGIAVYAWVLPWLAILPATAAVILSREDLRAIRLGALDASGQSLTRISCWLGIAGILCSLIGIAISLALVLGYWAMG